MKSGSGAIFVMPRESSAWQGSEALWITVSGWASAAERRYGKSVVITSDRLASPDEAGTYPIVQKATQVTIGRRR
jgi:hypothetical protein